MKSELAYSGMLVKELAVKSGVNKYSIDNYLNARGQTPSAEAAVKIARVLGVSVEYLVTGEEKRTVEPRMSSETRTIVRLIEQLTETDRRFVLDFVKWIKNRENHDV
ncbi:MAG: helix-turn-helix domain-containing protein [Spirochaetaceae bacterium]|nr:helix-turn-helix domain-containing protein [Spirochaetaceae bacterium]